MEAATILIAWLGQRPSGHMVGSLWVAGGAVYSLFMEMFAYSSLGGSTIGAWPPMDLTAGGYIRWHD